MNNTNFVNPLASEDSFWKYVDTVIGDIKDRQSLTLKRQKTAESIAKAFGAQNRAALIASINERNKPGKIAIEPKTTTAYCLFEYNGKYLSKEECRDAFFLGTELAITLESGPVFDRADCAMSKNLQNLGFNLVPIDTVMPSEAFCLSANSEELKVYFDEQMEDSHSWSECTAFGHDMDRSTWREECSNVDTQLGYYDWCVSRIEQFADEHHFHLVAALSFIECEMLDAVNHGLCPSCKERDGADYDCVENGEQPGHCTCGCEWVEVRTEATANDFDNTPEIEEVEIKVLGNDFKVHGNMS